MDPQVIPQQQPPSVPQPASTTFTAVHTQQTPVQTPVVQAAPLSAPQPVTTPTQTTPSGIPQQPAPLPEEPTVNPQTQALAQPLMQASTALPPTPQPVVASGKSKETGSTSQEVTNFVEVVGNDSFETEPLPPEVSSFMEKVNRDSGPNALPEVVVADATAQQPTGTYASKPVFVLPLGKIQMQQAGHSSVENSVRWLAEWCKRVVKKLGGQVAYNEA